MSKQEVLKVVPARYPLRLIGALFSLFILAAIVQSVAGNARWEWGVFAEWFFAPAVLAGLGQTLLLTLLGTLFSILFGTLLALARLSRSYLLASLARGYIWLFRSLPLILVLIILYNFSYLYDAISLGIPFTSVVFASYPTIDILGQFAVAVLGLTLVQSAYTAEIIRGGIPAWITASTKRRRRWACRAIAAPSASFCRRRCDPLFRPDSTRSSVWRKAPQSFTCWRCRSCFTPSGDL